MTAAESDARPDRGPDVPRLEGDAAAAVRHRGSHVQIIAAAGSGKTEVVSQRVADLLVEGVPARSVVAFTFTERAASELKHRVAARVEARLGRAGLDQLGGLFIGTIHSYCFQLLQRFVPRQRRRRASAVLCRHDPGAGLVVRLAPRTDHHEGDGPEPLLARAG